jgi:hypothetical protein
MTKPVADPETRDVPKVTGDVLSAAGRLILSRDAILAAEDTRYDYVAVPEWAPAGMDPSLVFVRVRSLTGAERDAYDAETWQANNAGGQTAALANFRARRVAKAIVDEQGARLFDDADIVALGAKNGAVIDRVDDAVIRLSGMKGAESVEAARTDLKADPSAGSGSDSRSH